MENRSHSYMVLHPNHCLIASQLDAERFARHYCQGSTRYFEGRLLFAELDAKFRNPYFDIDGAFAELKPHEDGRPKATKFIKSYRVLEHVDFDAIGSLYVCNSTGDFVELKSVAYDPVLRGDEMRVLLEINPLKMMVLTRLNYIDFGKFITDPRQPKGAPAMFYTQLEFALDEFLAEFEQNPFLRCHVPGIHPARLQSAIVEMRATPDKKTKGLSLDCPYDQVSYRQLRHGFMFANEKAHRFYPLLPMADVERDYYKFWKNM